MHLHNLLRPWDLTWELVCTYKKGLRRMQLAFFIAFVKQGFVPKILHHIHIWEQKEKPFSHCMISLMSVDMGFWNQPLSMPAEYPSSATFVCVLSPVLYWSEICLHLPSNSMLTWAPSVLLECVEPKYEVLGKNGLRPASKSTRPGKSEIQSEIKD